jgi:hypothetical protein
MEAYMGRIVGVRSLTCACVLLTGTFLPVRATFAAPDWQPSLIPPPAETGWGPSEPILIALPSLPTTPERLLLEVDDIDVTPSVSYEPELLVYTPVEPLGWGQHVIRLVEHAPDGSIIERGAWTIEVRKTARFREVEFRADIALTATQRIDEKNLFEPLPEETQGSGSALLSGTIAEKNWRMIGEAGLIHNSQEELMPNDKEFDLAQFLFVNKFGSESRYTDATVGEHTPAPNSFVIADFNRRGLSGGLNSQAVTARGFFVSTDPITGFKDGLAISDPENRTSGIFVTGRPLKAHRDALALSATALTSAGTDGAGEGVGGDPLQTEGDAASFIADGFLLKRRLRLRAEFAKTRFDFDGADTGLDPETDEAASFLAVLTPWHEKVVKNRPMAWNIALERKRIGTFFRSLANATLANDIDLLRLFSDFDWSGLTLGLSLGREEDNVEDIPGLGRTQTDQAVFSLNYSPLPKLEQEGAKKKRLFGQPSFGLGLFNYDQEVIESGSGLSEGPLTETRSLNAFATFGYSAWSWGVNYVLTEQDEFTDPTFDTRTNDFSFNLDFRVGERLNLTPLVQWINVEEPTTDVEEDTLNATLAVGYQFTNRLRGNLSLAVNHTERTDDTVDQDTQSADFSLNYDAVRPAGARPGVILGLQGSYQDVDDKVDPSASGDTYQVFFTVALSWTPTY